MAYFAPEDVEKVRRETVTGRSVGVTAYLAHEFVSVELL